MNGLAEVYRVQGRWADAEPLYRRALRIRELMLGPDHPEVSVTLNSLGLLSFDRGRYVEAESAFKRALAIDDRPAGRDHPDVATDLTTLGDVYRAQGRH